MNEISTRRHLVESEGLATSCGISVVHVRGPRSGSTLALLSGVHGDEWEGVAAMGRLRRLLREQQISGSVYIVGVCNELAFEAMNRCTPVDGRDLARCFPGDRHGSITERLAALLTEEVIRHADFLIDLHSAGLHYTMPTLVSFTGGESEMARMSAEAAACFGAPVSWRHPPPPPAGRTIAVAFEQGIPSIYTETTGAGALRERDIECYTRGVQNVMQRLSMLDGDPVPAQPATRLVGSGDLDAAAVRARHRGMLIRGVELLQRLEVGDEVGRIVDPAGEVVETLVARRRGVVVMLRHAPKVAPGDRICHLANLEDEGDAS
jgi:predicted deacylase